MDSQFRITPAPSAKSASVQDTVNSFGLHDTLQYGPRSIATEVKSKGNLRERLENWEATQDNLKLNLQRNVHGMHAPMRLLMERKIVSSTSNSWMAPQSNVHLDILMGRDEAIEPADVFLGMESTRTLDVRKEMEKKFRV